MVGGHWLCFSTVTIVRCRSTKTCQSMERSMNRLCASVEGNIPIIMRLERHSPSGQDAHGKAARNCSLSGAARGCMHACLPARASRRPVEFIRPYRWLPNAMRPPEPRPPCNQYHPDGWQQRREAFLGTANSKFARIPYMSNSKLPPRWRPPLSSVHWTQRLSSHPRHMPAMMKRLALCAAALGSASAFAPMGGTALRPASLRAPVMRVTVTLVRAAPFAPRT